MARSKVFKPTPVHERTATAAQAWREDRLARAVCGEPLFRHRVRLLLASGVLAFSAVGAGTSVATEPDQGEEGVSMPGQSEPAPVPAPPVSPAEPAPPPSDDSGAAPFEVEPAPVNGGGGTSPGTNADGELLEGEPADDPYGRLVLSEPETPAPPIDGEAPTLPSDPSDPSDPFDPSDPSDPAEGPPLEAPAPTAPAPVPGEPLVPRPIPMPELLPNDETDREPAKRQDPGGHGRKGVTERHSAPEVTAPESPSTTPVAQAPASEPAESLPQPPPTTEASPATPPRGIPRFHVVRRGESLWSIATALLAPDASPADIAREVRRLWRLNARRIGTGDPNLLIAGVKLRLR